MIGDFQNNYRSGWDVMPFNDDMPFNDFSREPLNLNFDYQIPHDMGFADDWPSSHHTSAHFADDNQLEYQSCHRYADDWPSSHHTSAHYADKKRLKDRKLARFCKRHLPHQRPECDVDKRQLPDQMPGHYSDKRPLPHQTPKGFAGKRNLPHQPPEDFADRRSLPHQKPEEYADNKCLPHRAPKPYSDKRRLPQQTPKDFADKKCLPHQTPGPTIPALAPVQRRQSNIVRCKICNVTMPHKCLEEHNNGKKHRMKLEELHEQSTERSVPNGRDSRLFPNSSGMNPVVQPMKVAESKKNEHPVENVCREAPRFSNKEVPAVDAKLKSGDNTGPKDRGFKVGNVRPSLKQKNVLTESSTRKLGDNTGPKDCSLKGENVKNEAPILKHKNVPAERSKRKLMDNTGVKDDGSKRDIMGAVGDKYMKMDNGVRRPVKSSKPEANDKSGSVKSPVQRPGLKQPLGSLASPTMTPIPVEGSSFEIQSRHVSASLSRHVSASLSQESKGKEHQKFQNIVEKNGQPQLVNASTGSNMTDTAGFMTNNQKEVLNSDFAAVKVVTEPLASAPPDASASCFELLTEHGLHTEIEPQVSEAAVEIDAPAEVSTETEAADESSQSEVEMDVLVTVSETTKLPQIPVCLTCGDVGFEETLVSCNKCKACALHSEQHMCINIPEDFADKCSPPQTLGPTIPAIAPVESRQSNIICCKICNVKMHCNCLEGHNNGKKHRMLLKSTERSVPNGRDSRVFPNSSGMKLVVQPMKVAESKKNGHPVENVCREAPRFSNKEVPAVGSKLKFGDYAGAKDRGFKVGKMRPSFKQKNVLAESSTRKLGDNTSPKDRGLKGENVKNEAPILKHKNVPAERSKRKLMDNTGAKDDGSKRDIMGAVGDKYMKMDNGVRRPVKSSKPETNDKSGSVKSLVQKPGLKSSKPVANTKSSSVKSLVQRSGLKQPSGCVASPRRTPIPVEGSSFEIQSQHVSASLSRHVSASLSQESKGKEHHKFQNIVEKNDQPQLVNASTGSNMTDTTGSMTNNQTEVVNSDYAAVNVVTEPDASASSFELLSERGLDTVVEPQVSEAAVEIDAPSEVSTETEAADESSQSEVEMDVLVTVSETTKLPQIPVCLTCGDVGFEETLVSCNKCKACALHRYCLDGPVIFTDEVLWFCEDCEPDVVVINDSDSESTDSDDETTNSDIEITDSEKGEVVVINDSDSESTDSDDETTDSDIEITDSEKGEVDFSKGCATAVTIADPQPISDPIWRGSLLVLNKSFGKIITGLLCHLSTLASPKVLEETRHLPNVLDADMIQREAVWPESFQYFGTNNLSIGLYFFPQDERDERYFDQLVDEMISNDLAMRAMVEKAELLIFPSTMLPRKYKRFQSKYYLWGVYRRNQVPSKIHDAGSRNEES